MQTKQLVIVSSAAGLVVGAAVGYLVAEKRAQLKWESKAEEEILSVKKHYGMIHDPDDYDTPEEAAEADRERIHNYLERLDELDYRSGLKDENVEAAEPEEDTEAVVEPEPSVEHFDKNYPYPVNSDEFFQDHDDYPKITIHYYEKDDILADDRDELIDNRQELLGNCLKFKAFDKTQPDVVYVVNHNIGAAYEVLFEVASYREMVLGIPDS